MSNLLIVGHGAKNTGFSRITEDIIDALCPYFNISHFAINADSVKNNNKFRFIPNSKTLDPYGVTQINDLIVNLKADIVLIIHDLWNINKYLNRIRVSRNKFKIIAYCPIDGKICGDKLIENLQELDGLIVYNKYSFNQLKNKFNKPLFVVPHCINTSFHIDHNKKNNFSNNNQLKKIVFGDQIPLKSSFVILNANRNSYRKRIDLTLKGFEYFAQNKDDVFLCLHSDIKNSTFYKYLSNKIKEKIVFPFSNNGSHTLELDELNLMYNACDIGLNTSMGEGWGLISFEHAITGAAQIVPNHSSCSELWKDRGLLIKSHLINSVDLINLSVIDIDNLVLHLNSLYSNRKYLIDVSMKCYNGALELQNYTSNYHSFWMKVFNQI